MLSILYLLIYLLAGCFCIRCLLPQKQVIVRVYLGLALGVLLMMWLPALIAFVDAFSVRGHLLALIPLAAICAGCFFVRDRHAAFSWSGQDKTAGILLLCIALPLTIVCAYILHTHVLLEGENGLYTGQATYGDLNLHLSIITSLRDAKFPADYAIFPGERLSYPFLTDSLSTSFMLFGMSLRMAVLVPSVLLLILVFSGYILLCLRLCATKKGAVLATLFFFINGGLGFFYLFDMQGVSLGTSGSNELQTSVGLLERIRDVLEGWYQTPANHAEYTTYNLRWSNVIADMLIPQRTTMGGWAMLLPCLYLVCDLGLSQIRGRAEQASELPASPSIRQILLLGIMAGALTMVHTHSQLALATLSAGFMLYIFCTSKKGCKMKAMIPWLIYGAVAACLALPQLLCWTLGQASGDSFIRIQFNWVNNSGGNGLRDGYLWFYIKNIGLPFVLLILALFEKNPRFRLLCSGGFLLFALAEFVLFQPNEYDNNKLFYVWYMICAPVAADYAVAVFDRLKGLKARPLLSAACCILFFLTGALSIARECVSRYRLFSDTEVQAAEYIEENTDEHAVFMTYTQHINPVSSLAGRTIVCGPSLWLYWHGFDITSRTIEIMEFYSDPSAHLDTLEKYGVSYIMISSYERAELTIDYEAFEQLFDLVFESDWGDVQIYAVRSADGQAIY